MNKSLHTTKSLWLNNAFASHLSLQESTTLSNWFTHALATSNQRYGWVEPCNSWICVWQINQFYWSKRFRNINCMLCINSVGLNQSMNTSSTRSSFYISSWHWSIWPWTWLMKPLIWQLKPTSQKYFNYALPLRLSEKTLSRSICSISISKSLMTTLRLSKNKQIWFAQWLKLPILQRKSSKRKTIWTCTKTLIHFWK